MVILQLQNNSITSISLEICKLINLEVVDFGSNDISYIPPEIGKLKKLRWFSIVGNNISIIPPEIGNLHKIDVLFLNANKLEYLPKEIGQLINLRSLFAASNNLISLPTEISKLYNLSFIDIRYNPLTHPPIEVCNQGMDAIRAYFRQMGEGKVELNEAKILIVGEGGAGKTTLLRRITEPGWEFAPGEKTTHGINVKEWSFSDDGGKKIKTKIWDFGGQDIYHATHQFFLSKRALYLLVTDSRKQDVDFFYWLDMVDALSGGSPVVIVKNEKDDRRQDIPEDELRRKYKNLGEILDVNLATGRGVDDLTSVVRVRINGLDHVGQEIPQKWIKVKEDLESRGELYIGLEKFFDIGGAYGVNRTDMLQISGYLHDLGVCLHFQDNDMLKYVLFLKPQWVTDSIYRILDDREIIDACGVFARGDLERILSGDEYVFKHGELLELMKVFKLCYEIPNREGKYIAPQLLSGAAPAYSWEDDGCLKMTYRYGSSIPNAVMNRFIVNIHDLIEDHHKVWKNGAVLAYNHSRAEVVQHLNECEIRLRAAGNEAKDLMTLVMYEIDRISGAFGGLKYKKRIPCNCEECSESREPYYFDYDMLLKRLEKNKRSIEFHYSGDDVDIRALIGSVINLKLAESMPDLIRELKRNVKQGVLRIHREADGSLRPAYIRSGGLAFKH